MTVLRGDVQRRVLKHLCLLVDFLALADKYPHEVEVAQLARPPNMIEGLLTGVALA